ncbi:helicase-exonuclease AddAB subunit AddA [Bacillus sp. V3-13]|nr:helicase-exonuclease AddAB subunit AddA [Bacillus sp. V3-13]PLR78890.1 helicase-exonuclease AddAB subunit AddA [Bacillus sp. V3-13]
MKELTNLQIPAKPENVTWTDDQWKAIAAKGQDILVAAAAGSGKTAVLVERMIRKIVDEQDPINVDELLVVTFTNASAAEMRHRIGEALEKEIDTQPKSIHLRKQLSLLNRASISTLHSFCLNVIRKYYYLIDIDPGFRIANETEVQLLRDEVLDELFEEEYGKDGNDAFFALVDTFTNDRNDAALQDIVRELYDFARSNPSPEQYLDSIIAMYDVDESALIEDLPFVKSLLFDIELQLEGAIQLLEQGLELTRLPGGPAPRAENFIEDIEIVRTLMAAKNDSWNTLYQAMQSWSFSRAKTCRGDDFDQELLDRSQKLRDKAKKILQDIQNELFSRKPESFIKDMREMKVHIETLVSLVRTFSERFKKVKTEKGLVDFSDQEHYCLEILTGGLKEDGSRIPSEAAENYRNHFKEVFVDEYQDTNLVQEAILKLVAKENEETGNLFMVGDVKQSIYRFRLAEPNLFLGKYNRFSTEGKNSGLRIDLARNFRSRKEVLDGTNYLFKQLMGIKVGEIDYDEAAELKKGAAYPEDIEHPVEVLLIDQSGESNDAERQEDDMEGFDAEEFEQVQLEARLMATRIKEIIGERQPVFNAKTKMDRPATYRDIVILLRSMTWAPQIMEEFKQQGIPAYANLSKGYFEATEVAIMMSLLKIIDNPIQDIPFAAVLRSPIVGLDENELSQIRISDRRGSFYDAFVSFCRKKPEHEWEELHEKANRFLEQLTEWRSRARQGSLSELVWSLYRETHFFDYVGGLPGGKQRQANLRALYDRARQYESTSFRGLFRFLRFIERMMDRGDDLGAARALGEQEDVVRIMTIHSSKGLEFPIVFVAGLSRKFNVMDIRKPFMLDKDFGFAAKYVDARKRISYPSLPQLAFKRKKKMEMLAEEMRVLYVALTRAKEKLYLIGSVKDAEKTIHKWSAAASNQNWLLSEFERASAGSYMDWIGPSIVRHRDFHVFGPETSIITTFSNEEISGHPSCWKVQIVTADEAAGRQEEAVEKQNDLLAKVAAGETVDVTSPFAGIVNHQLAWKYGHSEAAVYRSKQSVSEIKRQGEVFAEESSTEWLRKLRKPILTRPKFMQEKSLTPAEKGTAMHMVMQQLNFSLPLTEQSINEQIKTMQEKELLTEEQVSVIEADLVAQFFMTDLGKRLMNASKINREVPFNLSLSAKEIYRDWKGQDEPVFVQGIIDCVFEDEQGTVLIDYKTDRIHDRFKGGFEEAQPVLEKRYKVQMDLYTRALEQILKKTIEERYLFFFDGGHIIKLDK